jgi:bis(5'-nucleosyl)-tetraphosphatase (symmetrical)
MSTYVVGDIQGCHTELLQLLQQVRFDPAQDKLWLVGDLVNRGADSLQVLRLVKSLGDAAITVLGNHDLHLLAVAEGIAEASHGDTLDEILHAPDRDELLHWLRHQRLLYAEKNYLLVHAGLLPQWTVEQAQSLANEVECALRGSEYKKFLSKMYGNQPNVWSEEHTGYARLRLITNALTRMRVCTPAGELEFKFKAELADVPQGYLAWFDAPQRASSDATVLFGHWSALGLLLRDKVIALDTGCLWGGMLTAIRLEDRQIFQVQGQNPTAKNW